MLSLVQRHKRLFGDKSVNHETKSVLLKSFYATWLYGGLNGCRQKRHGFDFRSVAQNRDKWTMISACFSLSAPTSFIVSRKSEEVSEVQPRRKDWCLAALNLADNETAQTTTLASNVLI